MNEKAPTRKQRLNLVSGDQDYSTKPKPFHSGRNAQQVLNDLARKWVRFGCAETPNEALSMLLEGCENG